MDTEISFGVIFHCVSVCSGAWSPSYPQSKIILLGSSQSLGILLLPSSTSFLGLRVSICKMRLKSDDLYAIFQLKESFCGFKFAIFWSKMQFLSWDAPGVLFPFHIVIKPTVSIFFFTYQSGHTGPSCSFH